MSEALVTVESRHRSHPKKGNLKVKLDTSCKIKNPESSSSA